MKKKKIRGGLGLAILAAGAIAWGGTKPNPPTPPPSNRVETVIIVTPLGDNMYNTKLIKLDKEVFDGLQQAVAQ